MRKLIMLLFLVVVVMTLLSSNVMAALQSGPAPNSGDGIPDGPGMDNRIQNGEPDVVSPGPAPNSGDGIPDGSGF